nr:hypothetical protein [Desulfobacterales bacterium]
MASRLRDNLVILLGASITTIAFMWLNAFWKSVENYRLGEKYLQRHEYIRAITFFDRSLHWYTPSNPYVYKSVERLWEIGHIAEKQGDIQLALIALRTIRQAFFGARSFYTPGKDWINKCDKKIASLMVKELGKQEPKKVISTPSARKKDPCPNIFWTVVLEVGFLGWIGSVIGFLTHALTGGRTSEVRPRAGIIWGAMFVVFYALWIIGMARA